MDNLMIDLETLGTRETSIITSIACVEFDLATGETGRKFYVEIDPKSSEEYGMTIDVNTLKWLYKQEKSVVESAFNGDYTIDQAISELLYWVGDKDYYVWGNAPSFDLNILKYSIESTRNIVFWDFRKERDVRSISSLIPSIKENLVFEGIAHNSLDDCHHQIKYCSEIYKSIMKVFEEDER